MSNELVMYGRTSFCPYQRTAERVFEAHDIEVRTIMIDRDEYAMQRVIDWTGFKSVPTIIVAAPGEDVPIEPPAPIVGSPRGIDRGPMITEATAKELEAWLRKHDFIE